MEFIKNSKYSSKKCRLILMLLLSVFFFFVEVVVGCITNSTALTADSFHMLTDIAALVITFISAKLSKKKWKRNTFGWARAEVLGALVNVVFLTAMCVTIIIEACKHFSEGGKVQEPESLVVVGALGFLVNLIGLGLLYKHGVSHGHSHGVPKRNCTVMKNAKIANVNGIELKSISSKKRSVKMSNEIPCKNSGDLNMRGAFLHVLNDALGSVIVIISALVAWKTKWEFRYYLDPVLSLIFVCLILRPAWPLLRESSLILLQSVPSHLNIDELQERLLNLDGVLAVHEFHVWQLAGDRIIATAHIRCDNLTNYMIIAERVKEFFHNEGIHSTTIQPEFFQMDEMFESSNAVEVFESNFCALSCPVGGEEDCFKATCCQIKHKKLKQQIIAESSSSSLRQKSREPFDNSNRCNIDSMLELVIIGTNTSTTTEEDIDETV